jgi:hypothetical protein
MSALELLVFPWSAITVGAMSSQSAMNLPAWSEAKLTAESL